MTAAAEAQALALHEAQRLLDEHGPWETGRGTYLESRDVAVLVQPAPSAPDGPGDAAGRGVDLVITMQSPLRPSPFAGVELELEEASGSARRIRLNARGQGVFRLVPDGTWRARLRQAEQAGTRESERPAGEDAEVIPLQRVLRRSALAAGPATPPTRRRLRSPDDDLAVEIGETEDGRLEITFEAPPQADRGPVRLARVTWAPVAGGRRGTVHTLVTPLARGQGAEPRVAKYDLASHVEVEGIDVSPPTWIDPSQLAVEDIDDTFRLTLYGMTHRAWRGLAEAGCCRDEVQDALRRALETESGS